MIDDTLLHAIGRLEQAVISLEERLPALSPCVPEVAEDDGLRGRYDALAERHDALRARTAAAVERLSLLIDSGEG